MNQDIFYRKTIFFIGVALLIVGVAVNIVFFKDYEKSLEAISPSLEYDDEGEIETLSEDYLVDESFSSHLPIVVIDSDESEFFDNTKWDGESNAYQSIVDPNDTFTTCKIVIYDNGKENVLSNRPTITSDVNIRYRGNSSLHYAKKQYLIKMLDDKGNNRDVNIMGMGKDSTWILNGSLIDKSMIRNYLAYNIAGQIMNTAVDAKLCEMLFYHDNQYKYMGVYLMTETVKRDDNRVPLRKYNPRYTQTSYILRRDRYDKWSISLDNYAYQNELCYGYLSIKYPEKLDNITDETIKYIEDDISQFEKALYSNEPEIFVTYRDYIDMDSFVDYFLINEFFGNYDAGNNSTYMYKEAGGKLTMGPVWDFDGAMDNYYGGPFDYDSIAFHESPWFDRMLLDPEFCQKLISRYEELRKGVLADEYIDTFIDTVVSYLGKAQKREWSRWGKHYIDSDYLKDAIDRHGVMHKNRNLNSFEEEIAKIKTVIHDHAGWLDENVGTFYMKTNTVNGLESSVISEVDRDNQIYFNYGALLAVIFVGAFFISIILIQKTN